MKRLVSITLGLAVLALVMPFDAGAVSHNLANAPSCITCHNAATPSSTTFNNACLQCHDATVTNPPTAQGTTVTHKLDTTKQGTTSHSWSGTAENPAAAAQKPAIGAMVEVSNVTGSTLACVNCHNPHSTNNNVTSYLRIDNSSDQICLDCHRSRNVTSHRVDSSKYPASHPVNSNYSDAVAAGGYNSTPLNTAMSAKMSSTVSATAPSGTLLCSTCHDMHDSLTQDGSLLRADNAKAAAVAAGAPDNTNFCTNCHSAYVNHNAKGQNIQCLDCHAAHVDYDPADPTGAQGANIKLVKRYMPGKTSQTFFRATDFYKNSDGSGVCQSCHSVPTGTAKYGALHDGKTPADCKTCHSHNAGTFTANVTCGGCHGLPPTGSAFYSGATQYSHKTTDTNCDSCHPSASATTHNDGTVNLLTNANACSACHSFPPADINHSTAVTNPINCDKCHIYTGFNGSFHNDGKIDLYLAALTCQSCHPALSSSHAVHVGDLMSRVTAYGVTDNYFTANSTDSYGYKFGCAFCHPTANANHWNGTIMLNGNGYTGTSKTSITCNASVCHSDGKGSYVASPNWYTGWTAGFNNSSDRCAMCHAASPTTGSHVAHTSINGIHDGETGIAPYASSYSCAKCHADTVDANKNITYVNHINGIVNVSFSSGKETSNAQLSAVDSSIWTRNGTVDTAAQPLSYGSYSKPTCLNIACHNNITTPAWGIATKISCVDCHSKL